MKMCSGTPSGATHTGTSTQEGTPSLGPGDTSVPVATAAEQRAKKGERGARPRESQAKGKAKRARGDGVEKAAKPAQAKAIDEDMSKKEKRAKVDMSPSLFSSCFPPPTSSFLVTHSFTEGNEQYADLYKT